MTTKDIINYSFNDVVSNIQRMVNESVLNPIVRELAIEITSNTDDPIALIYDWVNANVKYVPDPFGIELITSPIRMVNDYRDGKDLAEDCDGQALFVAALIRSLGIPAHVAILNTGGITWDHAVAIAYSTKLGREIIVDPTTKFPLGWEEHYFARYDVE